MPEPIGGVQPFAELARGGATVVYKGYQAEERRFVLLKTVRAEGDDDLAGRVEEEARLAAQVRHPNVVEVYGAGREGAAAFLITEFVEGLDLGALVGRGALPPALAAYVLGEAARGLAAAHDAGVLHRDLKPANLLIAENGTVKLADFGLASLAPSGAPDEQGVPDEVRGTLAYLAPELVRGEAASRASDLFSLGAILAEMLTGRPPFARSSTSETLDAVLHHDPAAALAVDPRVPPALADLAAGLLDKDPARRPAEAADVAAALEPVAAEAADLAAFLRDPTAYIPPASVPSIAGLPSQALPASAAPARRRRFGWGVAAGVLALLVLIAAGTRLVFEESDPPARPVAEVPADEGGGSGERESEPVAEIPVEELDLEGSREEASVPEAPPPIEETSGEVETMGRVEGAAPGSEAGPREEPSGPPEENAEDEPSVLPGRLVVVAEPWARVLVDGALVGTTPLGALSLPPGPYAVTFENPDFPAHTVSVEVASGEDARIAVSLWDLVGRVTFVVSPWAEVAVDGEVWDTVPPQERPLILTPGAHRLTLTHPALGTREVPLRIAAGESRTIRVNLAEQLP